MKKTQWDCDLTARTAIANRWHFCGLKRKSKCIEQRSWISNDFAPKNKLNWLFGVKGTQRQCASTLETLISLSLDVFVRVSCCPPTCGLHYETASVRFYLTFM